MNKHDKPLFQGLALLGLGIIGVVVLNAAVLAGSVWLIVKVLQWTGVL